MYSTANMGLTSWDQRSDDFDHTQLDANWKAIDQHDHSNARGVQIPTAGIAAQAITTNLLAPQAVTHAQLALNAVASNNIQNAAITNALIAAAAVGTTSIADGSVTYSKLEPHILPLGTVTLWYRGPGSSAVPGGGWEIMDGRSWGSVSNSLGLSTGSMPDMRGAFVQGTDLTGIGHTGGSNTTNLTHAHNVNSHTHSVPEHEHGILPDGIHSHTWNNGLSMWTRTNSFDIGLTIDDHNSVQRTNHFYSMYVKNGGYGSPDTPADMDSVGLHSHTGNTLFSSPLTSGTAAPATDSQLGSVTTVPAYVGLLFIMLVR